MKKGNWHIEITEHYAFGSDSMNYILKVRGNKRDQVTGEPIPGEYGNWINTSFFTDFNLMCRHLKHRMLRDCEITSVEEIYQAAREIDELFSKLHFLEFKKEEITSVEEPT